MGFSRVFYASKHLLRRHLGSPKDYLRERSREKESPLLAGALESNNKRISLKNKDLPRVPLQETSQIDKSIWVDRERHLLKDQTRDIQLHLKKDT